MTLRPPLNPEESLALQASARMIRESIDSLEAEQAA
jgi:hypothetical protein